MAAVDAELGELPGVSVGVGPVRAALGAARWLATHTPTGVVLVGTAGAYAGGPAIGSVVVARRVGLSGGTSELGGGYTPLAPEPFETDAAWRAMAGVPEADVFTVSTITTHEGLAHRLAATWQVEHMETWSVGAACREAGVPFVAVLGISNQVGPGAHEAWLTHRAAAEAAARQVAQRLLAAR